MMRWWTRFRTAQIETPCPDCLPKAVAAGHAVRLRHVDRRCSLCGAELDRGAGAASGGYGADHAYLSKRRATR